MEKGFSFMYLFIYVPIPYSLSKVRSLLQASSRYLSTPRISSQKILVLSFHPLIAMLCFTLFYPTLPYTDRPINNGYHNLQSDPSILCYPTQQIHPIPREKYTLNEKTLYNPSASPSCMSYYIMTMLAS